jgi:phosphoribosyl 1,2-cyclic phosphodiesterase
MGPAEHRPLGFCGTVELGPFRLSACPTSHDAAEPLAVAVEAGDGARIGVAYDLGRPTAAVRYLLRDLSAIVLEANHDDVLLRTSGYPPVVQRRIAGSGGHLSNRAAAELLAELHHPGLGVVVLAHLSRQCNSADDARAAIGPALRRVGFGGVLHVADQDEPLGPIEIRPPGGMQLQLAL